MNLSIVFPSYQDENGVGVPVERLRDHFIWNAESYREFGDRLRVYVVTDVEHELPSCALCVIFPMDQLPLSGGRRRFSITRTKNAGIDRALDDGADVIVATDVDIRFPSGSLDWLASVKEDEARFPLYHMMDFSDRDRLLKVDVGCTGTTSMTAANWRRIHYDDRLSEYGGDDGALLGDIRAAGLTIERDGRIDHIGHMPGDGERIPGAGSETCWGRAGGFNRCNIRGNRMTRRRG